MNSTPQHGDVIVTPSGKPTRSFQEFLDETEYVLVSNPPSLDDGKTRKRVINIWWNETDSTLEHEVI